MWWMMTTVVFAQAKFVAGDAAPCMDASLGSVVPTGGQTDVPPDARLIALTQDNGCGGQGTVSWSVRDVDRDILMGADSAEASARTGRADLWLPDTLEVDTVHELEVSDVFGGTRLVQFTTGTELAARVDDAPAGVIQEAGFEEDEYSDLGTWTVSVDLAFEGFASGLSVVRVHDASTPEMPMAETFAIEAGHTTLDMTWVGSDADELCLFFVQEDEAGRDSDA